MIILFSVLVGLGVGILAYLAVGDPGQAVITGGGAVAASVIFLDRIIA
ncbi:hypothetical protein WEI85_05835 [Actinomycetes bacterium KLBMP 9797]